MKRFSHLPKEVQNLIRQALDEHYQQGQLDILNRLEKESNTVAPTYSPTTNIEVNRIFSKILKSIKGKT